MLTLAGTYTALVTPFRDGHVDSDRLERNIEAQIAAGITGVVPCGTTGESPTLSHDEHRAVVEQTVRFVAGRCQVIAGAGSNATAEAQALSQHAADAGADAVLMVNPYYNRPTQAGLIQHFETLADAVDVPMVLYNIPGRTAVELSAQTIAHLAQHERIVGVKEATGKLDMTSEIVMLTQGLNFNVISGDDSLTLPLMAVGATGVTSVLSNLLPARVKSLVDAAARGDYTKARELHVALFPLCRGLLSLSTNPIPIKAALAQRGEDTGELRLPMTPLDDTLVPALKALLATV